MPWQTIVLTGVILIPALLAQSAGLSDAEIQTAINAAKEQGFKSMFVESHGRFAAYFSVLLQGPVGRTMDLAREAFESYKPMKVSDVSTDVRVHEVTLTIIPHVEHLTIKNIVIMPLGVTSRDAAIQALPPRAAPRRDVQPRTWKPRFLSELSVAPLFYRFAEKALPPGDLQIIVVTEGVDERYTIRAQERDLIR